MHVKNTFAVVGGASLAMSASAGLVASYSFDETNSGVATPIIDSIGPVFSNGGAGGGVNLDVDGVLGSGIAFDGVNDVAGLGGSSSEFKQTGDFTVALWVQMPSIAPNVQDRLIDATNTTSGIGGVAKGWRLLVNPGGARNAFTLQFQANGGTASGAVNATFGDLRDLQSDGGWSFVAVRYDADGDVSISVLYDQDASATSGLVALNTQSIASDGALSYGSIAAPRLGANSNGSGNFFRGGMDELRLWDSLLTDSELAAEFNRVIPSPGSFTLLAVGVCALSRRRRTT